MPTRLTQVEKTKMVDKVRTDVILYLKDRVLRKIAREKTVTLVWEKYESLYMTKSLTHRLCSKQQFYSLEMLENKSIVEQLI